MATMEDNGGCDTGEEAKSTQLIRLSMDENNSPMSGAFVADMMFTLDGDTSGMENRDLDTVAPLVG